eukprot:TRINITY_DN16219_c0_g1_i1.p1 TRINITY_DN16219_c0_g1~~TRINITY_DN16219_c0_g1_i1.p1  ORF type:complete len:200 (-),score=38.11 TRINITY_DN16219_c0_g1_i1:311-820(-)
MEKIDPELAKNVVCYLTQTWLPFKFQTLNVNLTLHTFHEKAEQSLLNSPSAEEVAALSTRKCIAPRSDPILLRSLGYQLFFCSMLVSVSGHLLMEDAWLSSQTMHAASVDDEDDDGDDNGSEDSNEAEMRNEFKFKKYHNNRYCCNVLVAALFLVLHWSMAASHKPVTC